MQIDDLTIVNLSYMNKKEQIELILAVRERRRVQPQRKQKKEVREKIARPNKVEKLIDGMTEEQLEQLALLLRGVSSVKP